MPTLKELMTNPTGPGTAHTAARYRIIDDLNRRFRKMLRDGKRFRAAVYRTDGLTLFHVQVPSETLEEKRFWWDVLIEARSDGTKKSLMDSEVRLFSNNPAFVFTGHAHIAHKGGFLIDWLKEKLGKDSYEKKPVVRNPSGIFGFDKSFFFAATYILEARLHTLRHDEKTDLDTEKIGKVVEDFEPMMAKYKRAVKAEESARRREREAKARERASLRPRKGSAKPAKRARSAGRAVRSATKRVKKTKRVKRAGRKSGR